MVLMVFRSSGARCGRSRPETLGPCARRPGRPGCDLFDLVVGVLVTEAAALLLVIVEGEADTAVNPTLADLVQPPYSPMLGQGVCDLRQACGVGDACKAVSFFGEDGTRLARLAGHVFVASTSPGREREGGR